MTSQNSEWNITQMHLLAQKGGTDGHGGVVP